MNTAERMAAFDEGGKAVAQVYCARCADKGRALATVRASSRGLVYKAWFASSLPPDVAKGMLDRIHAAGQRAPFVVGGSDYISLTDDDPRALRAECPRCGIDVVDRTTLLEEINRARGRARLTIHH